MYCKKCGNYLPDDSVFCNKCGTSTFDGTPVQPGNYQNIYNANNSQTQNNKNEVFCVLGFLFSLLLYGFVGLILSIIGVNRTAKYGTRGKGLGITGIIIGAIKILLCTMILITGISKYLTAAKASANTTSATANYKEIFETDRTTDTPDFSSVFESVNASVNASVESELNDSLRLSSIFGNTYINNFFDFSCTLDGWSFYSDEQIAELNKISVEEVSHTRKNLPKDYGDSFYDMKAEKSNADNSIVSSVVIKYVKLYDLTTSESRYSGLCFDATVDGLESKGYTIIQTSDSTYSIAGKEHASYYIESKMNNISIYQRGISIKCDDYMCDIIVTCGGEDQTDEILASFH